MPESRPQSDMPADLPEPHWPHNMIQVLLTNDKSAPEAELLDESLYASLFQRSGIGKALLDITGRMKLVNASLATLLGCAQDEITGLLLRDCFARLDQPLMQTTLEQLEQVRIESYQSEKSLMHKEGQALWVRLHLIRLTDPASGQPGLLLKIQDLTRQQQEETAWRDHHERLVLAERLSGVGYSSLDLATGYVYWSQAMYEIFGQTPGLFTPDLKAALEQCIHPAVARASNSSTRSARICTRPASSGSNVCPFQSKWPANGPCRCSNPSLPIARFASIWTSVPGA